MTRPLILTALALVLGFGQAQASTSILSHDLRADLLPSQAALEAVDTLTLKTAGSERLVLALSPSVHVRSVKSEGGADLPFSFDRGELTLATLPPSKNGILKLTLSYRGVFNDPVPQNPVSHMDPSYGVESVISTQGVFLGGGSGWYADLPGSHAHFTLRVEAPAGFEAVTAGARLERGDSGGKSFSLWQTSHPLSSLTLSAGPYQIQEARFGSIPIYTYFRPESASLSQAYLKACAEYLELYTGLFSPYPFEKFAVVENFFPTGYGFPSWTLLGSTVIRLPFILSTSLGHEIAHSWWGTGVSTMHPGGNWAEGLTTYVADHLYQEQSSTEAGREYRLKILRDYASLVDEKDDFALRDFTSRRSKADQAVGYGKAAMVFHMARKLAGEEAFNKGLKHLAQNKMFGTATWEDFARALDPEGRLHLVSFFKFWVERTGAPELALMDVKLVQEENQWRVKGLIVQSEPPFPLPLFCRVETAEGPEDARLVMMDKQMALDIPSAARPLALIIDPEADIFRRLAASEVPPTVNSALGAEVPLVILAKDSPAEMEKAVALLLGAYGYENPRMIREERLGAEELKRRNLLLVGAPKRGDLIPELPMELQLETGAFTLGGKRYEQPDGVLFAALPHPVSADRTLALFHPLSTEAALVAARKIPHYGKYSYLVFTEGANRLKGTWPPQRSPLIFRFDD